MAGSRFSHPGLNAFCARRQHYQINGEPLAPARPITLTLHFEQYHGAKHQRHPRQHLVGVPNSGHRGVNTAAGSTTPDGGNTPRQHAHNAVTASRFAGGRSNRSAWRLHAQQILQHKSAPHGTRILRRQNKRFKQNGEIDTRRLHPSCLRPTRHVNVGHPTASVGAPPARG